MAKPETTDGEFLGLIQLRGVENMVGAGYGSKQAVLNRMARIQKRQREGQLPPGRYPHRQELTIKNGTVIVFSDCHWWPGQNRTTAHAALIRHITREVSAGSLKALIANGDIVDAASINRHPSIGWETKPTFAEELEVGQENLGEIEDLFDGPKIWDLGNHDANYETQIANHLPNMRGITGMHLKDHFPAWIPAWSTMINDGKPVVPTMIKHRYKGGDNAPLNNTKSSGVHIVTGHLHAANVVAYTDYRGTRYGVDTGTLAVPIGPQFVNYTEDNPLNWRSAFGILTYHNYTLLRPELVEVLDEKRRLSQFRGVVTLESRT